ncbi:MAG: MBL fold metallo-hydrolase [Bacteroidales bacterium]|nr:MBL fold metallo-hydrolase [Bacteroidales bacterium]
MANLHFKTGNLTVKIFHFNFIQVNTYIVYDDTREAVIIDPGNYDEQENERLERFIIKEKLSIKYIINTHPHIDHILGNHFCKQKYGVPLWVHPAGMSVYQSASSYGALFHMPMPSFPNPDCFFGEDDKVLFGRQQWDVLYTPGHCDGSICLHDTFNKLVFTGDVLFEGTIGRTDLPTGDLVLLLRSINEHLIPLEDKTLVLSGHGASTTIGNEKKNNPYFYNSK